MNMEEQINKIITEFMKYFKEDSWSEVKEEHTEKLINYLEENSDAVKMDVVDLFRKVYANKLDFKVILSENQLRNVAEEMMSYYENNWIMKQANLVESHAEYHDRYSKGRMFLYYNKYSKKLMFSAHNSSYYSQYVGECCHLGENKEEYMNFILYKSENIEDLMGYIKWTIAKSYSVEGVTYKDSYSLERLDYSKVAEEIEKREKNYIKTYEVLVTSRKGDIESYPLSWRKTIAIFETEEEAENFGKKLGYPRVTGKSPFFPSCMIICKYLKEKTELTDNLEKVSQEYCFKNYHSTEYKRLEELRNKFRG